MTAVPPVLNMPKILVVDDNPIIQRTIFFQLRDAGYKVLTCGDLTESLGMVRAERPNVIILDINFPAEHGSLNEVRDGFWATKWFGASGESKNIPVILISSAEAAEAEPRALAAGAARYFQKPIDKTKLLALIQKLVAEKKPDNAPSVPVLKMAS